MRTMLDAHPEVRSCEEETSIVPGVLATHRAWPRPLQEKLRLEEAGLTEEVLDAATQAFILEVIAPHGQLAACSATRTHSSPPSTCRASSQLQVPAGGAGR